MRKDNEITGKPTVLKELNIGLIKAALGEHGQATRVEIAKLTGISQPTVNLLIKELIENETVLNLGAAPSTGGRRAEVYTLSPFRNITTSSHKFYKKRMRSVRPTLEFRVKLNAHKERILTFWKLHRFNK